MPPSAPPRPTPTPGGPPPLVFDACTVGVVLRAVVLVQAALAVGTLYVAHAPGQWLGQVALLTGGSLPGTLAWLMAACSLKRPLQGMGTGAQYALGVLLGAASGLFACALLRFSGQVEDAPWLASAVSGAFLAAFVVTWLIQRAHARDPAQMQANLAELQSRIRPHFLFNALNSAIALVRTDPQRAETLLEDLSELFRRALADSRSTSTLREELYLTRHYLDVEQVRFGRERLRVHWQLDARADEALLPPLLLQPLVENAIRHGVEPNPDGATVRILTGLRAGKALISVSNTLPAPTPGVVPKPTRGNGIALANVRARLALLHDLESHISIRTMHQQFVVRITVPLPGHAAPPAPPAASIFRASALASSRPARASRLSSRPARRRAPSATARNAARPPQNPHAHPDR